MRKFIKKLVRGFYWLLGVSILFGITVVFPWSYREDLQDAGWVWWWIPLTVIGGATIVFGLLCLRDWAFKEEVE